MVQEIKGEQATSLPPPSHSTNKQDSRTAMSLTRTLASTARLSSLARPASLSLPHLLRPSSRSTFLSASAPATRSFSTSFVARERYSPVAGDPKWRSGKPVTYEELKPLTEQPDEVRLSCTLSCSHDRTDKLSICAVRFDPW